MEKALLVINPRAGRLKGVKNLPKIVATLHKSMQLDVYKTEKRGDGETVVQEREGMYSLVIACGGDGTLHEVVNGLMKLDKKPEVGYIPCGSTNDFASSLSLPLHPVRAAEIIRLGGVTPFDVGSFGDKYFSYIASFGAFTDSSYATSQHLKNQIGHSAYVLEGIKRLGSIRSYYMRVTADGRSFDGNFIFGSVSNTTSLGGIVSLDKNTVRFNDGAFELMLVREPENQSEYVNIISDILSNTFYNDNIIFFKTKEVTFKPLVPVTWSLDGECAANIEDVTIKNNKRALNIRV